MKKLSIVIASIALATVLLASLIVFPTAFADKDDEYEVMDKKGKKMTKKMKSKETVEIDGNNDNLTDYFYKIKYNSKKSPNYELEINIADRCIGGSSYDDARMKIGFSNQFTNQQNLTWFTDGFDVWTDKKSAKKLNQSQTIDLVDLPDKVNLRLFPTTGDDIITADEKIKKSDFKFSQKNKNLDKQSGWKGKVFFNVPEGEYIVWTAQPAFDVDPLGNICGGFTGIGIRLPLSVN